MLEAVLVVKQLSRMRFVDSELPVTPEVCKHSLGVVGVLKH